ncbi:MAG: hypothetical protein D8M57_16405 [Candidatus Scalindua sp. AMX11]|nr:MAG: hypothetical protein DWQ00_02540 [Candidatus Scalindua sp.]NOG83982.1 hypothetical protein [Planctomycetota bacterium]RZV88051.1 MAG: hypothetical protein EX341_07005 [Candidatus Scalindua sp. SCAELEC01]TDE63780.1 MAG: hypothetical protein D8M57_16405 [Candidatus Scalindua sp. AMX11]GJQ58370.1 MAG: hypothetical protein SCALA701_11710 [Candidatus Scalindua sp.]
MLRKNKLKVIGITLFFGICLFVHQSFADTLIGNSVPNLNTRTLTTVPAGSVYLVNSAIIAKNGSGNSCCQRLFRSNYPMTGFISVESGDSVEVMFDPPLVYLPGQTVQVRNGASSGAVSFTLNFTRLQ